ncbi:MAG: HesA/MoeB/ThiF family protein [Desulfobulbaceae bacterium]|nr:HesA/MoeB/ThiF family protein [Desulfobulbaceae bacterium]
MFDFTDEQLHRYSRNILLREIGIEGQDRLCRARVLVVGAGGLGSPAALYLAAAGIGTIGIIDHDRVDMTNLQRQILHATPDIGRRKVDSAAETVGALNPNVRMEPIYATLCADNILEIIRDYDFILDGTDNFAAKFLVNDACVISKTAFSHGGVVGFTGQTMTVVPGESACYRCIFRRPPPAGSVAVCSEAGVLGSVAGMLATIQATEAVKYLTGAGRLLTDKLLQFDALTMQFRTVVLSPQDNCPVCGKNPSIRAPVDYVDAECRKEQ